MCSTNSWLSPSKELAGPVSFLLASILSSLSEDKHRAKTDSPIKVTGIPNSKADIAVHLPVPFCPAVSLISDTNAFPSLFLNFIISAVI